MKKENLNFQKALSFLKKGKKLRRTGWAFESVFVAVNKPKNEPAYSTPYIFIKYPSPVNPEIGLSYPWTPSQHDLFMEDWQVVEEVSKRKRK